MTDMTRAQLAVGDFAWEMAMANVAPRLAALEAVAEAAEAHLAAHSPRTALVLDAALARLRALADDAGVEP